MKDGTRRPRGSWVRVVLLAAVASPALADVDLACPLCDTPEPLSIAQLLHLAFTTMLERGVAILLAGVLAVVGLPWLVAGAAVAALYLPGRGDGRGSRPRGR